MNISSKPITNLIRFEEWCLAMALSDPNSSQPSPTHITKPHSSSISVTHPINSRLISCKLGCRKQCANTLLLMCNTNTFFHLAISDRLDPICILVYLCSERKINLHQPEFLQTGETSLLLF